MTSPLIWSYVYYGVIPLLRPCRPYSGFNTKYGLKSGENVHAIASTYSSTGDIFPRRSWEHYGEIGLVFFFPRDRPVHLALEVKNALQWCVPI